jgi:hypothetical protein
LNICFFPFVLPLHIKIGIPVMIAFSPPVKPYSFCQFSFCIFSSIKFASSLPSIQI